MLGRVPVTVPETSDDLRKGIPPSGDPVQGAPFVDSVEWFKVVAHRDQQMRVAPHCRGVSLQQIGEEPLVDRLDHPGLPPALLASVQIIVETQQRQKVEKGEGGREAEALPGRPGKRQADAREQIKDALPNRRNQKEEGPARRKKDARAQGGNQENGRSEAEILVRYQLNEEAVFPGKKP